MSLKVGAACAAAASVIAIGVGVGSPAGASGLTPHRVKVDPQLVRAYAGPDAAAFACQSYPIDGSQGGRCYTPAQMQTAYGVAPLLQAGNDGTGRTIVIVDAYDNPYIQGDLSLFDSKMGLPDPTFTEIAPQGKTPFDINDDNQLGWASETSLDVEWAHAIAPKANITLVEAKTNQDTDLLAATQYAVDHNLGDVISQSFGEAETCVDPQLLAQEHQMFEEAKSKGMTVFASSGDSGASQFNCAGTAAILSASSPASDPDVTGVGGTTLNADSSTGAYLGETAWTEFLYGCNPPASSKTDINCSGGGFSTIFPKPSFQASTIKGKTGRGVPDVAYDAGVNGGVLLHCGVLLQAYYGLPPDTQGYFISGGTSAGSPQWAGLAAIADQMAGQRLGSINQALYSASKGGPHYAGDFHDVTTGNNDVSEINGGYATSKGWDPVTGLGTPNAVKLLPDLIGRITG